MAFLPVVPTAGSLLSLAKVVNMPLQA